MTILLYFILGVLIFAVLWVIFTYNSFVTLRNRARESWSDIDIQLKRRHDLIPNLIETVKSYAAHERELFEKVTETRTRAMGAKTMEEHSETENMLSSALKTLFAVTENYPQLKAAENFLKLQIELRDTEDKIQVARRFYNRNVGNLNIKIESVPANMIANIFKFEKIDFFELEETMAKESAKVQL